MLDQIKLLLSIILAMLDAMPQESVDAAGVKTKIPDDNYVNLIGDGLTVMVSGAGFQISGLADAQLRGALKGFVAMARAWKMAPRVAA
jgi:hypothetical protein